VATTMVMVVERKVRRIFEVYLIRTIAQLRRLLVSIKMDEVGVCISNRNPDIAIL